MPVEILLQGRTTDVGGMPVTRLLPQARRRAVGPFVFVNELAVLSAAGATLVAREATRLMLLGGAPLGERFVWWNFVASSRERIEAAKAQWAAFGSPNGSSQFPPVPGEREYIPLPQR